MSGISHWGPPAACLEAAQQVSSRPETYTYGPDEGLPELRQLLKEKVETQNGLEGVRGLPGEQVPGVLVNAGA